MIANGSGAGNVRRGIHKKCHDDTFCLTRDKQWSVRREQALFSLPESLALNDRAALELVKVQVLSRSVWKNDASSSRKMNVVNVDFATYVERRRTTFRSDQMPPNRLLLFRKRPKLDVGGQPRSSWSNEDLQHSQIWIVPMCFFGMPETDPGVHNHQMSCINRQCISHAVFVTHDALWHPRNDLVISMFVDSDDAAGNEHGLDHHSKRSVTVIPRPATQPARHVDPRDEAAHVLDYQCPGALQKHVLVSRCNRPISYTIERWADAQIHNDSIEPPFTQGRPGRGNFRASPMAWAGSRILALPTLF